ncbi:MAG: hypothetical protein ACRDLS_13515, partial [Solirubrobacteraceae bacterium]
SGGGGAALAGRTVDIDASRSKVKRGGKVRLSGAVEAFTNVAKCEPGQSVQIQRRGLKGGRFKTFQTVRTDSKGNYRSTSFKVTSSKLYRARVLQTNACSGAQSAREKVTVKRRRK